jgi:hypothetical protein
MSATLQIGRLFLSVLNVSIAVPFLLSIPHLRFPFSGTAPAHASRHEDTGALLVSPTVWKSGRAGHTFHNTGIAEDDSMAITGHRARAVHRRYRQLREANVLAAAKVLNEHFAVQGRNG